MNLVLIVAEDDGAARQVAAAVNDSDGLRAVYANSVADAVAQDTREAGQYDAVLLIWSGAAGGLAASCSRLRLHWSQCPILALAAQAGEQDVVASLDAGASDFLIAPYRASELRARLRAQIRAFAKSAAQVFQIGPHRFEPATRSLRNAATGVAVRLTHKETEVLKFLYRAAGATVARQTLLREVWGYKEGADSYTVESHIYRLRRKLEQDATRPSFILNTEGGYVLVVEPRRVWPPIRLVSLAG